MTTTELDAQFQALNLQYQQIAAASTYDRGFYEKVAKYLYDVLSLSTAIFASFEEMKNVSSLFTPEALAITTEVAALDLQDITQDLKSGNYLGNRKIDINLALNNASDTEHVAYSKADIILNTGVRLSMPFEVAVSGGGTAVLELTSHADIKNYIATHPLWSQVTDTEITVEDAIGSSPQIIRITDADGQASNLDRIELYTYSGSPVETRPAYFWAKTTSALQTLANRSGDLIKLGNEIDSIIQLASHSPEIDTLSANIAVLQTLSTNINAILAAQGHANTATQKAAEANGYAAVATDKATIATNQANTATAQAVIAAQKAAAILGLTVQVSYLVSGSTPTVSYNSADGKITFGIPQGPKGDKGDNFQPTAQGLLSQRSLYDARVQGFSFLAEDTGTIYFKLSATSGDWSVGAPFGRGDKGDTGDTGNGIVSIGRTAGDGSAGTTDTYTIVMSDTTTHDFTVYNGADSDIMMSDLSAAVSTLNDAIAAKASINDTIVSRDYTFSSEEIVGWIAANVTTPSVSTVTVSAATGTTAFFEANITNARGYDLAGVKIKFQTALQSTPTEWVDRGAPVAATSTAPVSLNADGFTIVTDYLVRAVAIDSNNSALNIPSEPVPFSTINEVIDADSGYDISGATFTTSTVTGTNATVSNTTNDATADANGAYATGAEVAQQAGEGDFSKIIPSYSFKPLQVVMTGVTALNPEFTSEVDFGDLTGSKIYFEDGGAVKECVAGTVTKTTPINPMSTYLGAVGFSGVSPAKFNDGLLDTYCCYTTTEPNGTQYLTWDFGTPKLIEKIRFYSIAQNERLASFKISLSNDNGSYTDAIPIMALDNSTGISGASVLTATAVDGWVGATYEATGRYMRFYAMSSQNIGDTSACIAEFSFNDFKYSLASTSPILSNPPTYGAIAGQVPQYSVHTVSGSPSWQDATVTGITRATDTLTLTCAEAPVSGRFAQTRLQMAKTGEKTTRLAAAFKHL